MSAANGVHYCSSIPDGEPPTLAFGALVRLPAGGGTAFCCVTINIRCVSAATSRLG